MIKKKTFQKCLPRHENPSPPMEPIWMSPSSGACLGVGAAVATTEDAIARWPRTAEPWEVIGGWALKVYHTNKC